MRVNFFTKLLSVSTAAIAIMLAFQLFTFSSEPEPIRTEESNLSDYAIYSLDIPSKMTFAEELIPIERYDVMESFDRELLVNTYWQSQTVLFIKRANRYFPVIEPILKENGVPEDFKYLALIESSLMPRAQSPAGAVGFWQFLKATGKEYGLEINGEVDERYHIEKATEAACRYLKKMYDHYGSWTLSAAAYNAGRTGINRQLSRQKVDNYFDLLLNEETGRYVYRILAIKEILSQPDFYGFHVKKDDLYQPLHTINIEINDKISSFPDFAIEHNITYKELKDLNPWLRDTYLSNSSKKTYSIKLPTSATIKKEALPQDSTKVNS
ncbi:lytic transglycosylase domain-containing protein [Carboxylicivirga linearis]|uniref:Lytic transglycosylase domain-containing protein n=1 Tax=Carboxylicivirga linearis TaxID=1628157 RepID=A0ABS5JZK4_9BACT|nr:lytic transglycosylase domain-containing protein [Carboxylicivirga linearis]MBS2100345.1 lytic transglycosylase domain-containing protein [Carboxylicivirga linearis]